MAYSDFYIWVFFVTLAKITLAADEKELHYVPPDRHIEIVQGYSYTVGIEEDPDLELWHCSFISDTGLNCTFDVSALYNKPHEIYCDFDGQYQYENTVTPHGSKGLCQITVALVEATGPKKWTVTAIDANGTVVSNKKDFTVDFFFRPPLISYDVRATATATFANHMVGFGLNDLESCNVRFNNTVIDLPLHSSTGYTRNLSYVYASPKDEVKERTFPLGHGLCGIIYRNVTATIRHLEWTLTAKDKKGRNFRAMFHTRVNDLDAANNYHQVIEVVIGASRRLACGSPHTNTFCNMFNPKGDLVENRGCKYDIKYFTMNDAGTWRCFRPEDTMFTSIEYTFTLTGKEPEKPVQTWVTDKGGYLHIGCRATTQRGGLQCRLTAPNMHVFLLKPFLASDRYLALGTDPRNGVCALQIQKPIQEYEKGKWTCELNIKQDDYIGSPIIVGEPTDVEYKKHIVVATQPGLTFKIMCLVPFYAEYCEIRAPNQTTFKNEVPKDSTLGICSHTVKQANPIDHGIWTCSFSQETGTPDEEITVDVQVSGMLTYDADEDVDEGDTTVMRCNTGGVAISLCRFISPNGKGYFIENHAKSDYISYFGQGFEYGDCGIEIKGIKAEDDGHWMCKTEFRSDEIPSANATILLRVNTSYSNVAAIGIGSAVAVVLVVAIGGVIVVRRYQQRNHAEIPGNIADVDNMSQSSDENVFSLNLMPVRSTVGPEQRQN